MKFTTPFPVAFDQNVRINNACPLIVDTGLPSFRKQLRDGSQKELINGILDGILEVEWGGQFFSGPAAASVLFREESLTWASENTLAALSVVALQQAQSLSTIDQNELYAWLYNYNRIPISVKWAKRYAQTGQIPQLLQAKTGASLLGQHFHAIEHPYWWMWNAAEKAETPKTQQTNYKLYISPELEDLIQVFPDLISLFKKEKVQAFKLGKDLHSLLRPDKMIVYLNSLSELQHLAKQVLKVVKDRRSHGVPFTASLDSKGLLSWGSDPPKELITQEGGGRESWRSWICKQLAKSIIQAKCLGSGDLEPWQYALLRLELEGVHTKDWTPSEGMWNTA